MKAAEIRKALVAGATAASEAVAIGLVDGTAGKVVAVILAGLGAIGVYAVPNAASDLDEAPGRHAAADTA